MNGVTMEGTTLSLPVILFIVALGLALVDVERSKGQALLSLFIIAATVTALVVWRELRS